MRRSPAMPPRFALAARAVEGLAGSSRARSKTVPRALRAFFAVCQGSPLPRACPPWRRRARSTGAGGRRARERDRRGGRSRRLGCGGHEPRRGACAAHAGGARGRQAQLRWGACGRRSNRVRNSCSACRIGHSCPVGFSGRQDALCSSALGATARRPSTEALVLRVLAKSRAPWSRQTGQPRVCMAARGNGSCPWEQLQQEGMKGSDMPQPSRELFVLQPKSENELPLWHPRKRRSLLTIPVST
jgi:hypothetical protein